MIPTLLLLGATGDLARRYLFPALGALHLADRLPDGFRVVGAARGELDGNGLRRLAGDDLPADMLTYHPVDLADPSSLAAAVDGTHGPVAVYLALPPGVFATTIQSLAALDLAPESRIVVEKPFGDDFESARALNALLAHSGADGYRVDHVLGLETVQRLVAMRRNMPVVERFWNAGKVDRVEILWEETLGLEGRAGYFDRAGALKDVLQNHMLQLLALVGMELPRDSAELHERKLAVLRAARVAGTGRRARYTAGRLADGREVPDYADEDGVDPLRCTETYAEVALELQTTGWTGARFLMRAGKALARKRKLVVLLLQNGVELEIGIDGPEDIVLRVAAATGDALELRAPAPSDGLPAYAHVLLDVLAGTNELSVGAEEAERAWCVVAPVLAAWEAGTVPMEEYAAGSAGPS